MKTAFLLIILVFVVLVIQGMGFASESLSWRVEYDDQDRITQRIDPAGRITRYVYKEAPSGDLQQVTMSPPDGETVTWRLDDQERLAVMRDSQGEVVYHYDDQGRLESVERKGAPPIRYVYDAVDRLVELLVGDFYHMVWTYDFLGRIVALDTPAGPIRYEYRTGQGTVVRILPNGVQTFWKRQPNGQLEEITHGFFKNPNDTSYSVLAHYKYGYGPDERIVTINERSRQGEFPLRYAYDRMGRLTDTTGSGGQSYHYEYDTIGNRTKAMVTGRPAQTYAYDWAGRLTNVGIEPCFYDGSGNLIHVTMDGVARKLRYHPDGRLADVQMGGETVHYRYDGVGRLTSRESADGETRFINDTLSSYWQPLVIEDANDERTLVIWDGPVPLALVREDRVDWFLHDHLGSVRLVTNDIGSVTQTRNYDPFGTKGKSPQQRTIEPGFAGLFCDHQTGVYLTLARAYIPELGVFLQPDPQKRFPSGSKMDESLYAYCGGDPVNFYDSDGHEPVDFKALYSRWSTKWESSVKWWTAFGRELFFSDRPGPPLPIGNEREDVISEIIKNATSDSNKDIITADSLIRSWRYQKNGASSYLEMHPHSAQPTAGEWQAAENYIYARKYVETGKGHNMFHGMLDTTPGEAAANSMANWQIPSWEYSHFWGERLENWGVKPDAILRLPLLLKGKNPWGDNQEGWQPQTQKTIDWQYRGYADGLLQVQKTQANHGIHMPEFVKSDMNLPSVNYLRNLDILPSQQINSSQFWHSLKGSYNNWDGGSSWSQLDIGPGWGESNTWNKLRTSPSSVGGVYLGGVVDSVEGMGTLKGVQLDANGGLVLVGDDGGDIKLPPLRLDDLVTIFRSVYIHGEGPSVTIDPNPADPENSAMIIKHGKGTEDTYVGWVLYEADRLMKGYTQGVDNKTEKDVESRVPGYADVVETIYFGGVDPRTEQKKGNWERFWIVPAEANRFEGQRKELTLFDVPLKVNTQKMKWVNGKLVDDKNGESSPGAMMFTKWFTENYEDIAAEQYLLPPSESGITNPVPVFTELRRIALITVAVEKLYEDGVPMPFWIREHEVRKVPFEKYTPGMEVTRRRQEDNMIRQARIFGGVQLAPESKVVKTYASVEDVKEAPRDIRAKVQREVKLASVLEVVLVDEMDKTPLPILTSQKIVADGNDFKVAAMPGAETKALGPCRLDEVDVVVSVPDGSIQLKRSFNSFFNPKGPWGKGWALNLPQLEQVTVPVKREGDTVATTSGYELITPLNSYYARFLSGKPVKSFAHPDQPNVDTASPFDGLYIDNPDFFRDLETDLIQLKDGQRWHFSESGNLVAIEDGALTTVYERDHTGKITRIAALHGGALVAQITMKYDSEGRLEKATGTDLLDKGAIPVEVDYSYNEDGRLAYSEEKGDRVWYEYAGPWVSSVSWLDAGVEKSEPVTLASYEYNANGQVVSEQRGEERRNYSITAIEKGFKSELEYESTAGSTAFQAGEVSKNEESNGGAYAQYDNQMRPVKTVAADGTTTEWVYNPDGKVKTTTTTPDGWMVSVTESADGKERIIQSKDKPEIRIRYDDGGRMVAVEEDGRKMISQQWRPDGQPARIETESQTAALKYGDNAVLESIMLHPPTEGSRLTEWQETNVDRFGRPVAVKDSAGLDLQMGYDAEGNLQALIQKTLDGNLGFNIERDNEGRVEKIASSWGNTDYVYADDGELELVTTQRNSRTASIELSGGLVHTVTDFDGGCTSFDYYKEGDIAGMPKSIVSANGLEIEYEYDTHDRLSAAKLGVDRSVRLDYDDLGRIVGYQWESMNF